MEIGDLTIAAQYFEEYVSVNLQDEIAFFLLGKCYYNINDYLAALLVLQRANIISSNNHRILYYIGLSYSGLGEESDAALTFRKALKINPEDPEILQQLQTHLNAERYLRRLLDRIPAID